MIACRSFPMNFYHVNTRPRVRQIVVLSIEFSFPFAKIYPQKSFEWNKKPVRIIDSYSLLKVNYFRSYTLLTIIYSMRSIIVSLWYCTSVHCTILFQVSILCNFFIYSSSAFSKIQLRKINKEKRLFIVLKSCENYLYNISHIYTIVLLRKYLQMHAIVCMFAFVMSIIRK